MHLLLHILAHTGLHFGAHHAARRGPLGEAVLLPWEIWLAVWFVAALAARRTVSSETTAQRWSTWGSGLPPSSWCFGPSRPGPGAFWPREEALLAPALGADYAAYLRRTPALLPGLGNWPAASPARAAAAPSR